MNTIADDRCNFIPNEVQLVLYVTERKLIGIVDDFGTPLAMEYEWHIDYWQKVANLGHDIELIKRKYGVEF